MHIVLAIDNHVADPDHLSTFWWKGVTNFVPDSTCI